MSCLGRPGARVRVTMSLSVSQNTGTSFPCVTHPRGNHINRQGIPTGRPMKITQYIFMTLANKEIFPEICRTKNVIEAQQNIEIYGVPNRDVIKVAMAM